MFVMSTTRRDEHRRNRWQNEGKWRLGAGMGPAIRPRMSRDATAGRRIRAA